MPDRGEHAALAAPSRIAGPLSFGQERLWVLDRLAGGSAAYNVVRLFAFDGPLDRVALGRALDENARRHEVLRSFFVDRGEQVVQAIASSLPLVIDECDWSGEAADRQDTALRELVAHERGQPFDLTRAPLTRVRLVRLGEYRHVLCRTTHHIIDDKWSGAIFFDELARLYEAYHEERDSPLPCLPAQYADYVTWQRRAATAARLQADADYWHAQLAGAPDRIELPTDRRPPRTPSFEGAVHRSTIEASRAGALRQLARSSQVTLYMCLLAGFGLLLGRYSGQNDLVISSPVSDRRRAAFEPLIGFFINVLPVRIRLHWRATFRELLEQVRQTTCEAFQHGNLPAADLWRAFAGRRPSGPTPLTQVALAMQNVPTPSPRTVAGVHVAPLLLEQISAPCDLELYIHDAAGGLRLSWVYQTELFDGWRLHNMAEHFARIMASAAADPDCPIGRIDMMATRDRHTVAG